MNYRPQKVRQKTQGLFRVFSQKQLRHLLISATAEGDIKFTQVTTLRVFASRSWVHVWGIPAPKHQKSRNLRVRAGFLLYKYVKSGAFTIIDERFIGEHRDWTNVPIFKAPSAETTGRIWKILEHRNNTDILYNPCKVWWRSGNATRCLSVRPSVCLSVSLSLSVCAFVISLYTLKKHCIFILWTN